jgi:hypothetical protein
MGDHDEIWRWFLFSCSGEIFVSLSKYIRSIEPRLVTKIITLEERKLQDEFIKSN